MKETFPTLIPRLERGERTETMRRLEQMHDDPALEYLQPGLRELYSKVKGAVEKDADSSD
jgi:hypothetical protein